MIDIFRFLSCYEDRYIDTDLDAEGKEYNSPPHIYYNNDENGSLTFGGEIDMDPTYVIVTDGSTKMVNEKPFSAAAGIVINLKTDERSTFSKFLGNYDTSYAELFAIKHCLNKIMDDSYGDPTGILIFSDSETSVNFINGAGKIQKSSDKSVEELRRWIVSHIKHNKLYVIRAIHIKSHTTNLGKMKKHFDKAGLHFNDKTTQTLMEMNHEVDRLARETCNDGLDS